MLFGCILTSYSSEILRHLKCQYGRTVIVVWCSPEFQPLFSPKQSKAQEGKCFSPNQTKQATNECTIHVM